MGSRCCAWEYLPCRPRTGRGHCRVRFITPDVMELTTLADVRSLVEKHLPKEYRAEFSWRQLAGLLKRAAEGQRDVAEVSCVLQL
jgi:hypothetical protein